MAEKRYSSSLPSLNGNRRRVYKLCMYIWLQIRTVLIRKQLMPLEKPVVDSISIVLPCQQKSLTTSQKWNEFISASSSETSARRERSSAQQSKSETSVLKVTPKFRFANQSLQNPDFEGIYLFSVNSYHTSAKKKSVPYQSSFIVLKFQRNRTKPELIRILFLTPLLNYWLNKGRMVAHNNGNTRT